MLKFKSVVQCLLWATLFLPVVAIPQASHAQTLPPPDNSKTAQVARREPDLDNEPKPWLFRGTDNLATLMGYLLVAGASIFAYRQWKAEQMWKRKEKLMELISAFSDTPGSRNAMMMLTSHDRDIPLFDKEKPEDCYVRVNWNEVARALIPADMLNYTYDPKQNAIRDSFEDFLGRLAHVEVYLEAHLLNNADAKIIIDSWARRIGNLSANPKLSRNLKLYINWRQMKSVQNLFARFGHNLTEGLVEGKEELAVEIQQGQWQHL